MAKGGTRFCSIVAVGLLVFVAMSGCAAKRYAYTCESVRSSNAAMPVAGEPVTIDNPSMLAAYSVKENVKQQLQDRNSIQARIDAISVLPVDLVANSHEFKVVLNFENVGDAVYTVPVDRIRLRLATDSGVEETVQSKDTAPEKRPERIYLNRIKGEPYFEDIIKENDRFAEEPIERDSMTLFPRDQGFVSIFFFTDPFEAGTLIFPLKNEVSGMETTLSFELKHKVTYRGARY